MKESYDLSTLRALLSDSFSDTELTTVCFDYFAPVYNELHAGMSRGQKIMMLLDYCRRTERFDKLLEAVKQTNPQQYYRYEPFLEKSDINIASEQGAIHIKGNVSQNISGSSVLGEIVIGKEMKSSD